MLSEIASGGMGVVFAARQRSLNRTVALKMIRSGQFASASEVRRFRTETEAAANLDHTNIVPLYEVGEHAGQQYFSMKLIEGGNLAEASALCQERDENWCRRSAKIVATIARALHHAHQRGLLHRDVKPTNILLDEQGQPHLTDFGLAKWVGRKPEVTVSRMVMGTPFYMAPEQAAGKTQQLTTTADIYSLGAVLYELLTGRPPFQGDSAFDILRNAQIDEPLSPQSLNRRVDADLETVCLKCLEKSPGGRYASAEALASDLECWLEGKPISARPVGQVERLVKWANRNPLVAALTALAVFLLSVGMGGILVQWHRAERNAERAHQKETESRQRLAQLNAANGVRLLDAGDHFGSLVWFAEALRLDQGDKEREPMHRLRFASILRRSPTLLNLWSPGGPVHLAEFSFDGQYILSASGSNVVQVWHTETGSAYGRYLHEGDESVVARFCPDGKYVVSVNGNEARVWSVESRQILQRFSHPGAHEARFSPQGQLLATGGEDGLLKFWSLQTSAMVAEAKHSNRVAGLAFAANGQTVLSWDAKGRVYVWKVPSGEPALASWRPKGEVRHAAFNSDGTRIATAHADGMLRIWDSATGVETVSGMKEGTWLTHVEFSRDDRRLVTSAGGHVGRILDASTGKQTAQLSGHRNVVAGAAFNRKGTLAVTRSLDGTCRVHDAKGISVAPPIRHGALVTAAEFHPDGERLLTASADGIVRLWSLREPVSRRPAWAESGAGIIDVATDGTAVIVERSDGMRVWRTDSEAPLSEPVSTTNRVLKASLAAEQTLLVRLSVLQANPSHSYQFERWKLPEAQLLSSLELSTVAGWLNPSPDGNRLAQFGGKSLRVLDGATGAGIFPAVSFAEAISAARFNPDSTKLVVVTGSSAHIVDIATGKESSPPLRHQCSLSYAEFSRDGRRIVTSALDTAMAARDAQVWNAQTGEPLGKALKHSDGVFRATFSPDGRAVATASEDGTARVWNSETGEAITPPLRHSVAVEDVCFSPDGRWVATASQDKSARVWDARTGEPLTPRIRHETRVGQVAFLANGHFLLTITEDRLATLSELPTEERTVSELVALATVLSGQHVDNAGALESLSSQTLAEIWKKFRPQPPGRP